MDANLLSSPIPIHQLVSEQFQHAKLSLQGLVGICDQTLAAQSQQPTDQVNRTPATSLMGENPFQRFVEMYPRLTEIRLYVNGSCEYVRLVKVNLRRRGKHYSRTEDWDEERGRDRQTEKETDRQTDRQTERDRERHRDKEAETERQRRTNKQTDRHQITNKAEKG